MNKHLTLRSLHILKYLICVLVVSLSGPDLLAQCEPELQSTRADIEARRYQRAITKLLIIQKECPQVADKVAAMIQETFALIEGERDRADSALAVAERVLDQMYFYEGKFGLTLKNIAKKGFLPEYRRVFRKVCQPRFSNASRLYVQTL